MVEGNSAAKLIKALMGRHRAAHVEEYSHRCRPEDMGGYWPENDRYVYTAQDLISYFDGCNIHNQVAAKYKKDYRLAPARLRKEFKHYTQELFGIEGCACSHPRQITSCLIPAGKGCGLFQNGL